MILGAGQRRALEILRPQRSYTSYFAGSLVIWPSLQRVPSDFDLHHHSWEDLETALAADRKALAAAGGEDLGLERLSREYQGWHRILGETVEINWVLETAPLMLAPRRHPQLGFALHPWDVIAKKLAMALEEDDPKHAADLARLKAAGFPLDTLADHAVRLTQSLDREEARRTLDRLLAELDRDARTPFAGR